MSRITGASLALLLVAGAALWGATLWGATLHQPGIAEASGHSATRAFASPSVAPGGQIQVTVTARNYGAFAEVVETLPGGFRYVGSSLPDSAVSVRLATVTFALLGEERFTYTVQAPRVEAPYSFSGIVLDQHKEELQIGGDTSLRVGAPPTPVPTPGPTPTPRPAATATPRPTATPTAVPTATPVPAPTATPEPAAAPTPAPTATPVPEPTATPTAVPPPAATVVPVVVTPDEEGGTPLWVWMLPFIVLVLVVGSIAYARSQRPGGPRGR